MLVVFIINGLIAATCWTVVVKLLSCRTKIMSFTTLMEKATIGCAQLQFAPLLLAEQQLQVLQLRQIYQKRSGQVDRLRQLIQLMMWLDLIAQD